MNYLKGLQNQYQLFMEILNAQQVHHYVELSDYYSCMYVIRKNTNAVRFNKEILSTIYELEFDTEEYTESKPIIYTDEHFDNLSENAKQFLIHHELGHFRHQLYKDLIDIKFKSKFVKEIEADCQAVSKLGKAKSLAALQEIKLYLNIPKYSRLIDRRINFIYNRL